MMRDQLKGLNRQRMEWQRELHGHSAVYDPEGVRVSCVINIVSLDRGAILRAGGTVPDYDGTGRISVSEVATIQPGKRLNVDNKTLRILRARKSMDDLEWILDLSGLVSRSA